MDSTGGRPSGKPDVHLEFIGYHAHGSLASNMQARVLGRSAEHQNTATAMERVSSV